MLCYIIITGRKLKTKGEKHKMKTYEVIKVDENGNETNYGTMVEEDVKLVTRGYKFNGLFYERSNSKIIYIVNEVMA